MDLSGLIFVALAIAWAAYLIPKALRHHDDVARGRSVDGFSQRMRVLARREPVSARVARLVVAPARTAAPAVANADPSAELSTEAPADAPSGAEWYDARRAATRKATRRRRRVLSFLLVVLVAVVAACATGRIAWVYVAVPTGLLVAWLVACRLMVRRERAVGPISVHAATDEAPEDAGEVKAQVSDSSPTEGPRDPKLWDPVPMTLPTYVSKPPARRSVRTIDLDSTGVWTSGRTAADAALAREAEAADRVRRRVDRKRDQGDEAVGS